MIPLDDISQTILLKIYQREHDPKQRTLGSYSIPELKKEIPGGGKDGKVSIGTVASRVTLLRLWDLMVKPQKAKAARSMLITERGISALKYYALLSGEPAEGWEEYEPPRGELEKANLRRPY